MLSNSSKYAIKAVLFLALNSNESQKIMVKDIARSINVPQAYIAKLLQKLSRQGIISSIQGPKGGFYLNRENREQSIISIIVTVEGENKLNKCLLSLENCDVNRPCPLHKTAYPLKTKLLENLTNKTINDMSVKVLKGKAFMPL